MDQRTSPAPATTLAIPRWEFIALAAALMALNALAIDIMLHRVCMQKAPV